jgi:hypothetical protein
MYRDKKVVSVFVRFRAPLQRLMGTDKLAIQSKGLPFLDSDTGTLGYSITNGAAK